MPPRSVLDPGPGSRLIDRPGLVARLEDPWPRRLTVLTAGAGYGKSTLVRQWLGDRPVAWLGLARVDRSVDVLAPRLLAALDGLGKADAGSASLTPGLREAVVDDADHAETVGRSIALALTDAPTSESVIVLDDLHELAGGTSEAFVAALVRQVPEGTSVVVTTRSSLPFAIERLRPRGEVTDLTAADLALDDEEVRRLARSVLGPEGEALAAEIRARTGGWPAMVRLVLEAMRTMPTARWPDQRAGDGDRRIFAYLAEELLAHESPEVVELIRTVAPFEEVDVGLCAAIGLPEPAATLADLERRGLFVAHAGGPGLFTLHRLVRDVALERLPLPRERAAAVRAATIAWLEERGEVERAFRLAADGAPAAVVAALARRHGAELVAGGRAAAVLAGLSQLDARSAEPDLLLLLGDAHAAVGQTEAALAVYRAVAGDAGPVDGGPLDGAVAWRMARAHLETDAYDAARAASDRGSTDGTAIDTAMVVGYRALTRFFANSPDALTVAQRAVELAESTGDAHARSLAHMAAAYSRRTDDPEGGRRHFRAALAAAEEARDLVQVIRLRSADDEDRSLLDQLERSLETVSLAEALGHPVWLSRTLVSRVVVLLELGRLEAAAADLDRVAAIAATLGRPEPIMAAAFRAELARLRGDLATSAASYRRVIDGAAAAVYPDIGAYASAHLARILAGADPDEARRLVGDALRGVAPIHRPDAFLSVAWVAARQGRLDEARDAAREVIRLTVGSPGWAPALASAIEVDACASEDAATRLARLAEASAVWREAGNVRAAAVADYAVAVWRDGPASAAALRARHAAETIGAAVAATEDADLRSLIPTADEPSVTLRLLGGFAVTRDGAPVRIAEWKSRKARDLCKILALHPGRPVTRDELSDILWPDEPTGEVSGRLSVAISLLRAALDPDHRHAADHHVVTTRDAVSLRPDDLDTDLDAFRRDARAGLAQAGELDRAGVTARLSAAEVRYLGDLLPEDAFSDWAVAPREEARALFLQVTRALAGLAHEGGDHDAAARHLMRTIEVDPFDEAAHLELVQALEAARHRGAARRAYELYVRRMTELEIEPAPYPDRRAS